MILKPEYFSEENTKTEPEQSTQRRPSFTAHRSSNEE